MTKGSTKQRGRNVPTVKNNQGKVAHLDLNAYKKRKQQEVKEKPRMVIVGDSPTVYTGFATVTRNLMEHWNEHYDMYTLGVNYFGDYHPLVQKYRLWPAIYGEDIYGFGKLANFVAQIQPEIVFILNDPWVAIDYRNSIEKIRKTSPHSKIVLYTPIDAENVKRFYVEPLNDLFDKVITYTEFGQLELLKSGLRYLSDVVPHGVDLETFYPLPQSKVEIRSDLGLIQNGLPEDAFIILTVARNSQRKGLDLTAEAISEWVKQYQIPSNVRWYYHGAKKDVGYDIMDLAKYYGIGNRLILSPDHTAQEGVSNEQLRHTYNSADLFFITTKAEGWCLPVAEAMACGIPTLIPYHSALAEWPNGATHYIDAPLKRFATNGLNTVHKEITIESAIAGLQAMYESKEYRDDLARKGLELVRQPKYNWKVIANQFIEIFKGMK